MKKQAVSDIQKEMNEKKRWREAGIFGNRVTNVMGAACVDTCKLVIS